MNKKQIMNLLRGNHHILSFLKAIRYRYRKARQAIFCIIPLQDKAVFMSFNGRNYSCNPKAISDALHQYDSKIKIIWLFNDPKQLRPFLPTYLIPVKKDSFRGAYHLMTARFWVDNYNKIPPILKRESQVYIQTWHGDRGFKKVLYDSPDVTNQGQYVEKDICDAMTVGSRFGERKMRGAFAYSGQLLKNGSPRNDRLVKRDANDIEATKRVLGIPENSKVLLYAPTYRMHADNNLAPLNMCEIVKKLQKNTGEEWVIAVRKHVNASSDDIIAESKVCRIIDLTSHNDMADVLLIADLMITDYSSASGDFPLTGNLVILYQPDRQQYIEKERELYFDFEDTPFLVAGNHEELLNIIESSTQNIISKNCRDIQEFYGIYESGNASAAAVFFLTGQHNGDRLQ